MLNSKKVRDMMVPVTDYPHILNNASVRDAFFVLKKNFEEGRGYRTILVIDEKNQLKGLLAMHDLIHAVEPRFLKVMKPDTYQGSPLEYPALTLIWQELFSERCKEEAKKPVKEVMNSVYSTITLEDSIAKAAYLLIMSNAHVLPVIDKERVIGVVRLVDIFNEIARIVLEV